jgi:protein SCO1
MNRVIRILAGLVMLIFSAGQSAAAEYASPWREKYFPNLPVITQDGQTLNFYNDVIKGKQVVVSFFYTNCPDLCPLTTARLALVRDSLGEAFGRDVFFVSLSVDPANDTPEKIKAYAEAFGAGPGWTFLTGKPEDMRAINSKFGSRSPYLNEHRMEILLGNDATGDWQRDSPFGEIEAIVFNIRNMNPKLVASLAQEGSGAVSGNVTISDRPGETLFRKLCTPCHTVGVGDRVGPDLFDVTRRRTEEWLSAFIMSPRQMRRSGDATALALDEAFKGVRMPELGLSKDDTHDLIAYLKAASDRVASAAEMVAPQKHHDQTTHSHSN